MPDHLQAWLWSLLDTPAPARAPQASGSGNGIPGGSGPRSPALSLSAGLHTSSSKTSAAIFDSPSTMFGLTWEQWATSVRQDFSRRRKLARRTNANASSSWPTPRVAADRASSASVNREGHWSAPSLGQAVELWRGEIPREYESPETLTPQARRIYEAARNWPTPAARDVKGSDLPRRNGSPSLPELVQNWPTPRTSDTNGVGRHGTGGPDLRTVAGEASARSLQAPATEPDGHTCSPECLRLNPQFVNWLQGFPPGWTDCESTETRWFPSWLHMHSERLRAVWESQRDLG
jgi:hypothetical protein